MDEIKAKEVAESVDLFIGSNNTINIVYKGEFSDSLRNVAQAEFVESKMLEIYKENPDEMYNILMDISLISKAFKYLPSKARQIYAGLAVHKQSKKAAVVGLNDFLRIVTGFIAGAVGKQGQVKFFRSKKEALKWLEG